MQQFSLRHMVEANKEALRMGLLIAQQPDTMRSINGGPEKLRRPPNIYVSDEIKPGCGCAIGVCLPDKYRAKIMKNNEVNYYNLEDIMSYADFSINPGDRAIAVWTQVIHDSWNGRLVRRGRMFKGDIIYEGLPEALTAYMVSTEKKEVDEATFIGWLNEVEKLLPAETA